MNKPDYLSLQKVLKTKFYLKKKMQFILAANVYEVHTHPQATSGPEEMQGSRTELLVHSQRGKSVTTGRKAAGCGQPRAQGRGSPS